MTVYCDRLTPRLALMLIRERLAGRCPRGSRIAVMDGPVSGFGGRIATVLLRLSGLEASERQFFAGHLCAATGHVVPTAARKAAFALADRASRLLVDRSPLLSAINARWQRQTVRLCLARRQWLPSERVLVRALTVEALSDPTGPPPALFLAWPAALPRELIADLPTRVRIHAAGLHRPGWKFGRFSAALWAARQLARRLRRTPAPDTLDSRPALLVPQEDDLSLDRSFRVQPHWLGDGAPAFRTIVLRHSARLTVDLPEEDRARAAIEVVELRDLGASATRTSVGAELARQFRRACARAVLTPNAADSLAANEAARLVTTAAELAEFCAARNVRAFLTCENYLLHADAMQLVAPALGIRTVSYQYSNISYPALPMLSTADQFVSFSPVFHERFSWPGFAAPAFVDAGYVYDSSFARVEARAAERRARLASAGARFVIGFFDESVQRDKYGLIDAAEHAADLLTLLELVERDPSVAVVFKTQFHHNLQGAPSGLAEALDRARATGRVEMPSRGRHRNIVLPAEVARSSDITIGHAFGGTASLESALAGCRGVMIDRFGNDTSRDPLYAGLDIICPSMAAACEAIQAFRRGDRPRLGDWAPVLDQFDPFRDGQSAGRLRAVLKEAVCH